MHTNLKIGYRRIIYIKICHRFNCTGSDLFTGGKGALCGKIYSTDQSIIFFSFLSTSTSFQDIVVENVGMYAHVVNIMVLILIPMVIIHINGHAFSLSK